MWISVFNFDLAAMRLLDVETRAQLVQSLVDKKQELRGGDDTDGQSVPGFEAVEPSVIMPSDETSMVVKRAWKTEAAAAAFVNFANAASSTITATMEQPV